MASVDPAVENDLGSTLSLMVRQAVAAYNVLPIDLRRMKDEPKRRDPATLEERVSGACTEYAHQQVNWWGVSMYVNDCLAMDLVFAAGTASAASGIAAILLFLNPPAAIVIGIVSAFLALYAGWLGWADQHCGNQGAYVNVTWNGTPWIGTVC